MEWQRLKTDQYINLEKTLYSGQIFSFQRTGDNESTGIVEGFLVTFKQEKDVIYYKIFNYKENVNYETVFWKFFTLDLNYKKIFKEWNDKISKCRTETNSENEQNYDLYGLSPFKENGLRLLRCDLKDTIFSFICSSNNNIKRITKMVLVLFSLGEYITTINGKNFYHFPNPEELSDKEQFLRDNGFGYRASYIAKTARLMTTMKYDQLYNRNYHWAFERLNRYSGISYKVADCVCLLGLHFHDVVPIDIHIFRTAKRIFSIKEDRLSKRSYLNMQRRFQEFFGDYSGLAQLVLFEESVKAHKSRK
ncbi:8-oxoguanine DNA-glycosylase (ogg) [Vavraia culicis subsp. floridensis]|uniref:DNA-(apurinic or apyrimidinic site) lyase n=1 Tax=Vavraia culicis (isolate floridensis) TaxID=948595 RepID=L2GYS4_VAVCU|nr:8-oxoguanine DNA-glycosylase (ogg) [Vavraia culicis subsp. floridensis]ELA48413.1 8-oxoguanine DNA-glycosylase (ogg) [Vavraia culicis subsp. floridensis]